MREEQEGARQGGPTTSVGARGEMGARGSEGSERGARGSKGSERGVREERGE